MNGIDQGVFDRVLSPETLHATAPFLVLSAGICLLVALQVVTVLAPLRNLVLLASLGVAGWFAVQQTQMTGERLVLEATYADGPAAGWWTLMFLASTLIAWTFGRRYYREEAKLEAEHDLLMLSAAAGMVLMAGSRDLLVFFVGLELLSVPLYALSGFRRARRESVEAGLKYFVLGAFAAATFLFGAALVYAATGTLTLSRMTPAALLDPLAITGGALVAASLFFKISVFPFHLWVPDVYQGSPSPVTTFMATGTKGAAFAFLLPAAMLMPSSASMALAVIALLTMAAGNLAALVQTDMKRLLAYSGVAHAGTMLLAVAGMQSGDPEQGGATQAILFYMAAYVATAGGAFGLVTMLESQTGRVVTIDSLKGLAHKRPGVAAAFALFMLSLGGIPATGGFLGKYLVFSVAVRADMIAVAILGVLLSVVALGYYLRVIVAMYMQPEVEPSSGEPSPRAGAGVAAFVCAAVVLALGVMPGLLLERLR